MRADPKVPHRYSGILETEIPKTAGVWLSGWRRKDCKFVSPPPPAAQGVGLDPSYPFSPTNTHPCHRGKEVCRWPPIQAPSPIPPQIAFCSILLIYIMKIQYYFCHIHFSRTICCQMFSGLSLGGLLSFEGGVAFLANLV